VVLKDDMRESIVIAASGIFSKFGFRKTTMDDIAKSIRKGKSSIYYYFRNKEDIFEAVLEMEVLILKSKLEEAVDKKKHHKDKLKTYIITRMEGFGSLINFYNAIRNEYLSQFEFIERIRNKYDQEEIGIIQGIFDEGIEMGEFEIEDTYLAAVAMVTSMKGFEIPLYITSKKGQNIEQRVDKLLKMLYDGIAKRD
jgi:AcrR family transcriptional regulator